MNQAAQEQLDISVDPETSETDKSKAIRRSAARRADMERYLDRFVVDALSRAAVIPTYSFPVHSIRLEIVEARDADRQDDALQLDRNAALAIGEYAPGAEVVAGGRIWTSRGIVRRGLITGSEIWAPRRWYRVCADCGHPEIHDEYEDFDSVCEQCGNAKSAWRRSFVEPTGFLTSYAERTGRDPGSSRLRTRPVDEARLLTRAHLADYSETGADGVKSFFASATPRGGGPEGRMFVVNKGPHGAGYYWCTRCEYAEPAPQAAKYGPHKVQSKHENPRTGDPCPNERLANPLDLGHVFETDIRAIHFDRPLPDFSAAADGDAAKRLRAGFLRTLAEALRLAAARLLDTDSRDLRAATELRAGRPIVILSDAAAGGAGYCKRLLEESRFFAARLLAAARDILDCSNEDCATSCSRCLNEYSNQQHWDVFDRQPCRTWLGALLAQAAARPANAPQDAIPYPSASAAVLSSSLKGSLLAVITARSLWGAGNRDEALRSARALRDYLETDNRRLLLFLVGRAAPTAKAPMTTVDREVADTLERFEREGRIQIYRLDPAAAARSPRLSIFAERVAEGRSGRTAKAPRLSIVTRGAAAEFHGVRTPDALFDGPLTGVTHRWNGPAPDGWLELNKKFIGGAGQIPKLLENAVAQLRKFRFTPNDRRDFTTIFEPAVGRKVAVIVRDPYIGTNRQNRETLAEFVDKLLDTGILVERLTLVWNPGNQPRTEEERLTEHDQRSRLQEALRRTRFAGVLELKPHNVGRDGHFHDRTVWAEARDGAKPTVIRWDVTAGIDNLMRQRRECTVFREIPS